MVKRKGGGFKKVHLSEFLGDAPIANPPIVPRVDECSTDLSIPVHDETPYGEQIDLSALPSAPRAQREGSFDPSKVPRSPPFTAFVGNLPFDSEDDDVSQLFRGVPIKEIRLMKDKDTGHFKGFGYVEFESAEGLIEVLKMNEKLVRNRPIKVDIATTGNRDGAGGDRWERGDRSNDGERGERKPYVDTTSDDWRRDAKPQDDGAPPERRRYDEDRPPRRYNEERRERPPREDAFDNFSRADFGTKQNEEAKEPYRVERDPPRWGPRARRDGDGEAERDEPRWGRGAPRDRESRAEGEGPWGRAPRDPPSKADEGPWERLGENATTAAAPVDSPPREERRRLNIKPRSVKPTDGGGDKPKSNPFGEAKPADTASWRSARVSGTGPIKTPKPQPITIKSAEGNEEELISDSNKFMLLNDEEDED